MNVVIEHTTIALMGTIIRPMYATAVMTIINLHYCKMSIIPV